MKIDRLFLNECLTQINHIKIDIKRKYTIMKKSY